MYVCMLDFKPSVGPGVRRPARVVRVWPGLLRVGADAESVRLAGTTRSSCGVGHGCQ